MIIIRILPPEGTPQYHGHSTRRAIFCFSGNALFVSLFVSVADNVVQPAGVVSGGKIYNNCNGRVVSGGVVVCYLPYVDCASPLLPPTFRIAQPPSLIFAC